LLVLAEALVVKSLRIPIRRRLYAHHIVGAAPFEWALPKAMSTHCCGRCHLQVGIKIFFAQTG